MVTLVEVVEWVVVVALVEVEDLLVVDVVERCVDVEVELTGGTYGYVELMSPNLMLENVALIVAAVVSIPPVQVPALGAPSSHDMPSAEASSHKLTANTIPVLNAVVKGVMPPTAS